MEHQENYFKWIQIFIFFEVMCLFFNTIARNKKLSSKTSSDVEENEGCKSALLMAL